MAGFNSTTTAFWTMPVQIVPYDPTWPQKFEVEKAELEKILGDIIVVVIHFGSTSVPGLAAKPIIDIQVHTKTMPSSTQLEALQWFGYDERILEEPSPTYKRFDKGRPSLEDPTKENFAVIMRDYLRCHADDRQLYQDAKYALAATPNISMKDYRLGKTKVMNEIAERVRAWHQEQTAKK